MSVRADRLDRTLAALADPRRRKVVEVLRKGPRRAGELAEAVAIPFPTMSRHLRTLRDSGLVEEERDAIDSRVRVYRLRSEPMNELRTWLADTEALWSEQLQAFRKHLKSKR